MISEVEVQFPFQQEQRRPRTTVSKLADLSLFLLARRPLEQQVVALNSNLESAIFSGPVQSQFLLLTTL
jgi:hypothetical protein